MKSNEDEGKEKKESENPIQDRPTAYAVLTIDTGAFSRLKPHETPENTLQDLEDKLEALSTESVNIEKELLTISHEENSIYHAMRTYDLQLSYSLILHILHLLTLF